MTVRFKGVSEYRSKYKGRATRSRSDSPHQRMRLAGLRSDQTKITREPQFQSKKKVPFYPPQVSRSLRWEGHGPSKPCQETSRPVTSPAVKPAVRDSTAERQVTPLAPRDYTPQGGATAVSQLQAAQPATTTAHQPRQKHALNGTNFRYIPHLPLSSPLPNSQPWLSQCCRVSPAPASQAMVNHVLRRKAGLRSERQKNVRLSSEYQQQFVWKTAEVDSPLLTAHEMFHNDSKAIPPFKSNPVIMESEYRRSFKGSARLRRDVEVSQLHTENETEKNKRKKKKERKLSRRSSPKEEVSQSQPAFQQQEVRSPCAQRDPSPKIMRKMKTEYRSNFRSPLQYSYRDGAWVKTKTAQMEGREGNECWYLEVQELREKAAAYRKRAWGTFFSHQHFNQINNPTHPVCRKLAWDEKARPEGQNEVEVSQEELNGERNEWTSKNSHEEPTEKENIEVKNKRLQVLETDSSEVEGSGGGRLPTPKLKTMQAVQRTHHDRTTPATGGALLVSPPKIKNPSSRVRRNEPPLGKPHSPYKHDVAGSPQGTHKAVNGSSPRSSPAAGLTTVDPLPMREDARSEEHGYSNPRQAKPSQTRKRRHPKRPIVPPPANRIQGTMRNPEFQHNDAFSR